MSSALANVFLGADHVVESGILDDLHKRFPLNKRALTTSAFDHEESDRIRLRRAIQALEEENIRTEGLEPSQVKHEWHVRLVGSLAREGNLKNGLKIRVSERESYPMAMETILQTTQMILQSQGFAVIVDHNNSMVVIQGGATPEYLPWIELGLNGQVEGMTYVEAEKWIATDGRFGDQHVLEGWHESGLSLEKAQEWMSKTTKDCRDETQFVWHNASQAEEWIRNGYDSDTATRWAAIGGRMNYYNYARQWIDGGMTPEETATWIQLVGDGYGGGFTKAAELKKCRITQNMAKRLIKLGFQRKSQEIQTLLDNGMKAKDAMQWAEVGAENFSYHQITNWSKKGYSPADIAEWFQMSREFECNRGYAYQSAVEEWLDAGLDANDARPWVQVDVRFTSYELVKAWSDLGLTPMDAKPWATIRTNSYHYGDFTYVGNVMEWQEIHPCFYNPANVAEMVGNNISPKQARVMFRVLGKETLV